MKTNSFNPSSFFGNPEDVQKIQRHYLKYFPEGSSILDLGCGEGTFLELLTASGRRGLGVDTSEQCINICKSHNLETVQSDILEFLRKNKSQFDGIFASHVVEHFTTQDGLELIQLATDTLCPNGILLIITPTYQDILVSSERFWLDITHVRPYPLKLLEAIFSHTGLEVVDSGYDRNTKACPKVHHLPQFIRRGINKLRFGTYYDTGDTFIVGRKK